MCVGLVERITINLFTMKKIYNLILSLLLSLSLSQVTVFAKEKEYSKEEFLKIIQDEGAKYDIDVELDELMYGDTQSFTQAKLDETLQTIKDFHDNFKIIPHESDGNDVATYASSSIKYGYFDVAYGLGVATITVEINASVSGSRVVSASIRDIYQSGVAFFFQSWTTTASSVTLNYPDNGYVRALVSGRATFNMNGVVLSKNVTNQGSLINCL